MAKSSDKRRISDPEVLQAMRRVNREHFVPESLRAQAHEDLPLPIGEGQTISQPYIVALMTQAVCPRKSDRCLEIGTGSGYQSALLLELCHEVYSIEYLEPIAALARRNLEHAGQLGPRLHLRIGDGFAGWPEAAPFDVIVVTAAPPSVPRPLLEQLAPGGRLVIPVGDDGHVQQLERWTRRDDGSGALEHESIAAVRFVPFLGPGVAHGGHA
ncbi:MAG: protein-L-isoaspartate(D-aspartate) O-methyltransferase [Polyangiaceae bacterium]